MDKAEHNGWNVSEVSVAHGSSVTAFSQRLGAFSKLLQTWNLLPLLILGS